MPQDEPKRADRSLLRTRKSLSRVAASLLQGEHANALSRNTAWRAHLRERSTQSGEIPLRHPRLAALGYFMSRARAECRGSEIRGESEERVSERWRHWNHKFASVPFESEVRSEAAV